MDDSRELGPRSHVESLSESDDRLSELPESLILQILSFLPMQDVVATTVLSKRWIDVWTSVPCLNFYKPENYNIHEFRRFVSGALELWKGKNIQKFSICFWLNDYFYSNIASGITDSCMDFLDEKQVEDIRIEFILSIPSGNFLYMVEYFTPPCLYSCSSIRNLSLVACKLLIEENVQWNKLESLTIQGVEPLSAVSLNHILSGAPLLEVLNLNIMANSENFDIRSSSLKMLKIHRSLSCDKCNGMLRVRAPNLKTLELSGIAYEMWFLDVPSLTSAILGLNVYILKHEIMRQVFQSIHHVEKLTLSDSFPECDWMSDFLNLHNTSSDIEFPTFPKLTTLVLELKFLSEVSMNNILGNAPRLEVLSLSTWESNESLNIVSPSLRIVKIHRKRVDICNSYYTIMTMRRNSSPRAGTMLRILGAPNLETLEISGCPYLKYLLNVPSLTKAILTFDLNVHQIEMLWGIFQSILHVEELTLSDSCTEVLLKMMLNYKHMPLVANAKFLKLYASAPEDIFGVFKIFPLMTMLVIKHMPKMFTQLQKEPIERKKNVCCFHLLQLKTIEITWPMQDSSIYPFIGSLLKYARRLEKMVFRNATCSADPESKVFAEEMVQRMPRSSPTAEVIIV